jgi:hypothetical protein
MCKISDKIKFCTCGSDTIDRDELDNYWILYRYNENKFSPIIDGLFYLITNEKYDDINKNTILNRLKENDAFDIPIKFEENDTLVIHLNQLQQSNELVYSFNYNNKEWQYESYNPLSLDETSEQIKYGKLDNAIKKEN